MVAKTQTPVAKDSKKSKKDTPSKKAKKEEVEDKVAEEEVDKEETETAVTPKQEKSKKDKKKDKKSKKDKKAKEEPKKEAKKDSDSEEEEKPAKKEKKEKKEKKSKDVIKALEAEIEKSESPEPMELVKSAGLDVAAGEGELLGALVPFAFPLVEEAKDLKKVLRTVKKSAKTKTLRRGVKEVVKALRKSETSGPASSDISDPPAVCIIAADISPMDVISHIPVLCEDHNIPYIYVKSRAELGEASATKRPTSVVMVAKERAGKKKEGKDGDATDFQEAYGELVKLAVKASKSLKK